MLSNFLKVTQQSQVLKLYLTLRVVWDITEAKAGHMGPWGLPFCVGIRVREGGEGAQR